MKLQLTASVLLAFSGLTTATVMHVVTVGAEGKLAFCPEEITANPGDLVQFQFYPKNHSVIQGFFAGGCTPISQAPPGIAQEGSFSGFMPVAANATTIPTFTITVNGTGPEWFYCGQGKHCQSGMVFAINPTAEKTLQGYKNNCASASQNIVPSLAGTAPAPAPPASTPAVVPTAPSLPSGSPAAVTALPTQATNAATTSYKSSRTAGWVVAGLAGLLALGMTL